MSSIDGIGGPKGPGGPGRVDPAETVESAREAQERSSVGATEAAAHGGEAQAIDDPAVTRAVEHVAAELRAGRIADVKAALEAVVAEIVETRYPQMAVRQRQQFTHRLQELLADDPGLGARLSAALERAANG